MNPYFGKNFWQVFVLFFQRMGEFITGQIGLSELASDEVQILVLMLVGFASALIGTFLVLKKMTMLANSLSHTILLASSSLISFYPHLSLRRRYMAM